VQNNVSGDVWTYSAIAVMVVVDAMRSAPPLFLFQWCVLVSLKKKQNK